MKTLWTSIVIALMALGICAIPALSLEPSDGDLEERDQNPEFGDPDAFDVFTHFVVSNVPTCTAVCKRLETPIRGTLVEQDYIVEACVSYNRVNHTARCPVDSGGSLAFGHARTLASTLPSLKPSSSDKTFPAPRLRDRRPARGNASHP